MANISILKNRKAKAIRMETLDKICRALECQPGDLLEWRDEDDAKPAFPKPRFYLILALLAAAGFGFTAVCGVWNIPVLWDIALSAVPAAVFSFSGSSPPGHWRGVPALAATIALFVLFLAGGCFQSAPDRLGRHGAAPDLA